MNETMKNYLQLSFRSVGISIINDITRDDLFYITINPSKEIWTEKRRFNSKPLSQKINQHLDEQHKKYLKDQEENNQRNYDIDKHRVKKLKIFDFSFSFSTRFSSLFQHITFDENNAEIQDDEGHHVRVQHESLDGLWLGFAWSTNNQAIHLRINHIQIDNQLQITLFPTILHPIVSKANATDIRKKTIVTFDPEKNFISIVSFSWKTVYRIERFQKSIGSIEYDSYQVRFSYVSIRFNDEIFHSDT
jgi:hypothetical protein